MKLSQLKESLGNVSELNLVLPDQTSVPRHFHITEAGLTTKHFIDCGGTVRTEKTVNLQVWVASDFYHRLSPEKLDKILDIAQPLFGDDDLEVEVEYQTDTVGKYGLKFDGEQFHLTSMQTDCLAKEQCGVPSLKEIKIAVAEQINSCCEPSSGCC
jgi:hypothetical protein